MEEVISFPKNVTVDGNITTSVYNLGVIHDLKGIYLQDSVPDSLLSIKIIAGGHTIICFEKDILTANVNLLEIILQNHVFPCSLMKYTPPRLVCCYSETASHNVMIQRVDAITDVSEMYIPFKQQIHTESYNETELLLFFRQHSLTVEGFPDITEELLIEKFNNQTLFVSKVTVLNIISIKMGICGLKYYFKTSPVQSATLSPSTLFKPL